MSKKDEVELVMTIEMNSVNIALDWFCICICFIICFYLKNRVHTSNTSRSFFYICFFQILFILGDLTDWCFNGLAHPWYSPLLHAGQFLYYFVIIPLNNALIYYIYHYLSSFKKLSKYYLYVTYGISILHLIGVIFTPFTGWYYTISKDNIYTRGDFVLVASILPVLAYILVICMTVQCWKLLHARTIISLLSYVCLPLFGQVLQNFFRGIGTLIPCITLSILFIFINIQLDRELQAEKNKQELQEANMKLMLSQIQPHFLYNTLTTIRHLCDVNPAAAKESVNDFALFLRSNMNSISTTTAIPFEQELQHVKSYLALEQKRFGDKISVIYDLSIMNFSVPALSVQPLVENAVRHGICKKEGRGTIRIATSEDDTYCYITIEDDGLGFQSNLGSADNILAIGGVTSTKENHTERHIGMENVHKRLHLLCNGTLSVECLQPDYGTRVTITLPKERQGETL